MIGAEAYTVSANRRAALLIERLHLLGDVATEEHAEILDDLEGETLGETLEILGARNVVQRLQHRADVMVHETLDPRQHVFAGIGLELLVGKQDDAGTHDVVARREPRDRIAEPTDETVRRQGQVAVAGRMETSGARFEFQRERLMGGTLNGLRVRSLAARGEREPETG